VTDNVRAGRGPSRIEELQEEPRHPVSWALTAWRLVEWYHQFTRINVSICALKLEARLSSSFVLTRCFADILVFRNNLKRKGPLRWFRLSPHFDFGWRARIGFLARILFSGTPPTGADAGIWEACQLLRPSSAAQNVEERISGTKLNAERWTRWQGRRHSY